MKTVRVWDLPTRIFHWVLATCVTGLVITGQIGGTAMEWHFLLGYSVLALLLFRLAWGLVGGYWSRFVQFIYTPATIWRYLQGRGDPSHAVGHSPLGAFSVFALLATLLVQVATGLMSDDEISNSGPLTKYVSNATVSLATTYHTEIGKLLLIFLVLMHVAAIVFYFFKKRQNLLRPMVWGDKELTADAPSSRDDARSRLVAAFLIMACAALVGWFIKQVS
jgi:cytochrome b